MTRTQIGRILQTPDCLAQGAHWLAAQDPVMDRILAQIGPLPLRREPEGFETLLYAILSQQVSLASARTVWARLEQADKTSAIAVEATDEQTLRALGLSRQKARYAKALATAGIDFAALSLAPDAQVIATLTSVPGIGQWTAEIYAMFALGRADVLASGDLALQEAVRLAYDLPQRPRPKDLAQMAQRWSPWRAVAARALWSYYALAKAKGGIR